MIDSQNRRHEGGVLVRNLAVCLSKDAEGAQSDKQAIYDVREHVDKPQLLRLKHFVNACFRRVRALYPLL